MAEDILKEVLKDVPESAEISDSRFEGANIVLYTKNKDFFLHNNGTLKEIVDKIKKRVELRPDPSLLVDAEKAEEIIRKEIPKEAGETSISFDLQRSIVVIEAEKPGIAIGKGGEVLKGIKEKTFWVPVVKRKPAIKSIIIEKIRKVLFENNDYRKKFLNKVGHRIYDGWIREKKNEWVRISFLGAARQVGRSCFLLQTPESRILLDCGVDVSNEKEPFPYLDAPEFDINQLDAIILSHPHTDHSALIPYLYKMGYKGPVYCTEPTRDIAALLCLDYIGIANKENKKSIYSSTDIKEMVKHTITLNYEEVTDITPDVRLTFYNAGHVLGSSLVHLHIGNGLHNFLYCGDLNYETSNLLASANTHFPRLETVMIESTYGGRDDNPPSRQESEDELIKIVEETIARKGKVLIPVLGVGRAQEVMVIIEKLIRSGKLKKIPVYVQGLVWDITAIHTAYPDYFNNIVKKMIFHKDQNPFLSEIFTHIAGGKEMAQVLESGPCVILATSGMLNAGASVEYFKHLAPDKNNSIVLVSYQGPSSLGRRVQNGEKEITLEGEDKPIHVNMNVYTLKGFSGHSTRKQLLSFIHRLNPKPKKVILVHGESTKCLDLASTIHKQERIETAAPKNLEVIRIK
ncbi:beta-CASP ribonuclease aCPSF1 [Candidatus Woesearchaeota archaeon]|nr:beta-CASP ribonuclease aCPSF1 [Candidatus Woesearchaeota archaeon]